VIQFTDPAVSQAKFDAEVARFSERAEEYRTRGILLLEANFPRAVVAFAAVHLARTPIHFAAAFDFTNYNARPLGLQFEHPFTREPLAAPALAIWQRNEVEVPDPTVDGGVRVEQRPPVNLVLQHPGHPAMLCQRGNRQYHEHPAHNGESWELYRNRGIGTLANLIENLHLYGIVGLGEVYNIIAQFGVLNPQR